MARVVSPATLAREVFEEIVEARERYQPRLAFEMLRMPVADSRQTRLPLRAERSKAS